MAATPMIDVAPVRPADRDTVGEVLARAFHDDPVFEWIVPDEQRRAARLPAVFAAFADAYIPHDESYVAGGGVGAALWLPSGTELGEEQFEVLGEQIGAALEEDAERAFEASALLDEHHPDEPCCYLQFMGVVPEQQGRGIGSRLLRSVLDRCDAEGTPAYLEATTVDNRRLYERHGFELLRELVLPDGPPLWSMWRDPVR